MSDRLKEFADLHRDSFDDREPSSRVWKKIESSLFPSRSLWNSVVIWRAAAVIFMALSVYLMIPKEKLSPRNQAALKEFTDTESFYVKQISEKVELIDGFEMADEGGNFTQDFKQLEAMYMVLKEEMKTRPSQKVKDALVLNLLVQIDLLNQQLHRLELQNNTPREEEKAKASI
jgi:hypothetical protein